MFVALFLVTACTNDEPVSEDQQQTEESESITTSLNQLRTQFDDSGNVIQSDNPAGNIVLDFCFDFVYPLTLSYNNGTTVSVEDLDGLVDVILASTEDLYINGIAFPFDVETFNDDTDDIEVVTINDEDEFIDLLEDCDFDDFETCECFEVYEPVCVEITDPNGEAFTVTYPNACYAECDGFTEDDFLDSCEDDYNPGGGIECFTLNYPLTIVIDDDSTITINSEEEFGNALYNVYHFDFVYPITVTVYDDDEEEIVTINGPEDIEELLDDCFDDYDGGDDECEECEEEAIDPVCIEYVDNFGNTIITVFPNMCYAECAGFTENNVIDCDGNNNPLDCDEEDIADALTQCEWYAFTSLLPQEEELETTFSPDGTIEVELDNTVITGTWEITSNPTSDVLMSFVLSAPLDTISNIDWTVAQCTEESFLLVSGAEFLILGRDCD